MQDKYCKSLCDQWLIWGFIVLCSVETGASSDEDELLEINKNNKTQKQRFHRQIVLGQLSGNLDWNYELVAKSNRMD